MCILFEIMKDYDKTLRYKLRLIWEYKDVLRNHCRPVTEYFIRRFRNDQLVAARCLKDKEKIEVAFLLTIPGMWKLDYLFRQLRELPRYHPYVVIYPYSFYKGFSPEEVQATLERTKKFIADKGFEYHIPYDEKRKKWLTKDKSNSKKNIPWNKEYKEKEKKKIELQAKLQAETQDKEIQELQKKIEDIETIHKSRTEYFEKMKIKYTNIKNVTQFEEASTLIDLLYYEKNFFTFTKVIMQIKI